MFDATVLENANGTTQLVRYSNDNVSSSDLLSSIEQLFNDVPLDALEDVKVWGKRLVDRYLQLIPVRFDIGQSLFHLKKLAEANDIEWYSVCDSVRFVRRTADRMISDYEEALKVAELLRTEALRRGYDLAEDKHQSLRKRLKEEKTVPSNPARVSLIFQKALAAAKLDKAAEASKVVQKELDAQQEALAKCERQLSAPLGEPVVISNMSEDTTEQWKQAVALTYPRSRLSPERKCLKLFVAGWIKQDKNETEIMDALTRELKRQLHPNDPTVRPEEEDDE